MKTSICVAKPCRNFCILGSAYIAEDPKTGGERFAVVSYAGGGLGALILIDPAVRQSESYPLPWDEGAWAVHWLEEKGQLLIGTCAHRGTLHRFDMKTRRYLSSLPLEGERYFWNFASGENGRIYGGTWPGGVLAEYDPETETLRNLGHVGGDSEDCYTKGVMAVSGGVVVNAGFHSNTVWYYDFSTERFSQVGGPEETSVYSGNGVLLTQTAKEYRLYSIGRWTLLSCFPLTTGPEEAPVPVREYLSRKHEALPFGLHPGDSGSHLVQLKNGEYIGIKGQDLVWSENGDWHYEKIPAAPLICNMMTVSVAPDGMIWGSADFGQTIFRYDPVTGEYENTSSVAAAGGEVYGMIHLDGKLFLTAYAHGDHILYDPHKPWNQYDNQNPRLLGFCSPEMVRPQGKSVLGADGNIWTGWWASYGVRGGGITKIDTKTLAVSNWFGIAGEQAIEHLYAGPDFLYAVTSGEASGLMSDHDRFQTLKLDFEGHVLTRRIWTEEVRLFKVIWMADRLVVSRTSPDGMAVLSVLDPDTFETLCETEVGKSLVLELVDCKNGLCVAFADGIALFFDPVANQIADRVSTPGMCQTAALASDGTVWYAVGEKLCCITTEGS